MFPKLLNNKMRIVPLSDLETPVESLIEFYRLNKDYFQYFHPHDFTATEILEVLNSIKLDQYYVIVLEYEGVIGYGMLRGWDEGYSIPTLGVAVDKRHAGLGLGTMLILFLHSVARFLGSNQVRIGVMKDNVKAKELYERLGYEFTEDCGDREYGYIVF